MSICRGCGSENEAGARVCAHCGDPQAGPGKPAAGPACAPAAIDDDGDPFRTCTLLGLRTSDGQAIAPRDESVLLGRDPASPICALCSDNVSRRHASLRLTIAGLAITDRDSSNGTFLNDVRLDAGREYPLLLGDRVTLAADPPLVLTVAELDVPESPR